jgi:hypothetical protein
MKIRLTYTIEVKQTKKNPIGYKEVTKDFDLKERFNGAFMLVNGWFVDYKYSPNDTEWEISKGEKFISLSSKPIIL